MNLKGKTVLITGAAKRVGKAIAVAFAQKGANVLVHYHHSLKEAMCLVCELRSWGIQSKAYRANLNRVSEISRLSQLVLKDFKNIDILVHNASAFYPIDFEKVSEKNWDDFLGIHVKAPFFLVQNLLPSFKKNKSVVILLGDKGPTRAKGRFLPYEVSKEALAVLSRKLAKHLAPSTRVVCVHPGLAMPPDKMDPRTKKRLAQENLLKTWGEQEDVAKAVVFLAEQPFITGAELIVDGGQFVSSL